MLDGLRQGLVSLAKLATGRPLITARGKPAR
jgi:hypothetical protein